MKEARMLARRPLVTEISKVSTSSKEVLTSLGQGLFRPFVILEILILIGFVTLFNFFPERIGVVKSLGEPSTFVPLFTPLFKDHMLWLNLFWGCSLILAFYKLAIGRWNRSGRVGDFILTLVGIGVFLRMAFGGSILETGPGWGFDLGTSFYSIPWPPTISEIANTTAKTLFGIIAAAMTLSLIDKGKKIVINN